MGPLGIFFVIIFILLLVGAVPRWGYNSTWGWGPFGIVGFLLLIAFILWLTGHLHVTLPSS